MKLTADLHVHTFLSSCARADALPENYLKRCPEEGITTVCFTDHFWDEGIPGASGWYRPQNLAHVMRLREPIPPEYEGIRVLYGAETEFIGSRMSQTEGGIVGISPQTAKNFSFVLIPANHFHMKGYTIPASVTDASDIRLWMIDNFNEAARVSLGVPTGIAHPFEPMGFDKAVAPAIFEAITDDDYRGCFSLAAAEDKSIELNHSVLDSPFYEEYVRIFSIARDCGCVFHTASDAHTPASFSRHDSMARFAERCGITPDRFLSIK
ncbi:MAG: PHP domain-containing protein [Eubacteriales bacterium]|nr:PHP domain-containing protein [Eubacteriales bacterium]